MSTKPELETWAAAVDAYDAGEYETALELFSRIERSSRFATDIGLIYAALGEHEAAVEQFTEAIGFDPYLAVAYFQCGVSKFLLARYELAYEDFERAMLALRGTQNINYEQLGLEFRLYSAEVLFNQGLSLISMGRTEEGLADLEEARRAKATDEHNVIDEAIAERGKDFTVFSIPVGVIYRPPEKKMKNIKTKDYLGKAILVAASDSRDTTVGFSGSDRLQQGITPAGVFVEGEAVRARNNTGAPSPPQNDDGPPPLVRPKATLNVVRQPSAGGPARSNPGLRTEQAFPSVSGPGRDLSVRRGGAPPMAKVGPPPPSQVDRLNPGRMTDFYDDYLGAYTTPWGVPRRNTSRRNQEDEDEEGYASGEDFDGPSRSKLNTIRIRIHHDGDVRGMMLSPDMPFDEFMDKLTSRFGSTVTIKFVDEDGIRVSLRDQDDYELAIETARQSSKGKREGKLEIWCMDV
ncbi:NADPH oxidase regulator NoxR [Mycena albidolilacea]|uniref:NADPH oxidase regulator NoxR n=1 Tax=Mycena albidolilacea TaxID=1033008 RepID=A0AAD7EWH5_9AGAR|nr:NADPH oxidase regulator NoxR [Mycena albidolilacea]